MRRKITVYDDAAYEIWQKKEMSGSLRMSIWQSELRDRVESGNIAAHAKSAQCDIYLITR